MPNYRDAIRTSEAAFANVASGLGIDLSDMRLDSRKALATGAVITRLANAPTPTPGAGRLANDDFAGQVYNGTNNEFTISQSVAGQNIGVDWIEQSTGTLWPLTKTTNPAPSALQFWFDGEFTIRVGTPPGALDGLKAWYLTAR